MVLDPTARETNVRDSLHKYFIDNLENTEGYKLYFDTLYTDPKNVGAGIEKWIVINVRPLETGNLSGITVNLHLFTRKDREGFKLSQMRDTVVGYFIDYDATDGMQRVPLYKSDPVNPWELLGGMVAEVLSESEHGKLEDNTKHKYITLGFRWGSK